MFEYTSDFGRQRHPLVVGDHRARRELRERLLDDPHALAHLLHAHEVAVVAVAGGSHRHVEVVALVPRVGVVLADVVVDARARAGTGPTQPQESASSRSITPTSLKRFMTMMLRVRSLWAAVQTSWHAVEGLAAAGLEVVGDVLGEPADAHVGDGEPRAAAGLEELVDVLPGPEHDEVRRDRAQVHDVGADADDVVHDPRELGEDHADRLGPGRGGHARGASPPPAPSRARS